jgi:hypothetical protein
VPRITLRHLARLFLGGLTAAAAVLPAERASASYLVIPPPAVAEASAAYKYANMTDVEALAELDKRKVPYKKADPLAGVVAPVRLTGKLHGVWIHSSIPESQRATSVYEVLDARLALALDDFAKILERHDIEEVVHYSLYRPNVPREEHDEAAHVAAREVAANAKADALAAKAPAPETKVAAPVVKAPAVISAHHGAGAIKGGVSSNGAAAKAGNKPGVTTVAKVSSPAKPHAAKTSVPASPGKALPQLPTKGGAAAHGAKRKDPLVIDKSAVTAPHTATATATGAHAATTKATATGMHAAAATGAHTVTATGTHAAHPTTATGMHAKTTAAKTPAPVRARGATPNKGAAPSKTATGHKEDAKSSAPAKNTPVLPVATAKNAPPATAAKTTPAAPVSRQTWAPPGTRHPAGLAIDVALLKKRDGQWISVAKDFGGKIGAKTCGDGVRTADTPEGRELRSLVCEANDLGVFTYVLTPNFNAAHYDHFHMEVRPTVKWFLYQ